jgi:hypothetical protein
MIAPPKPPSHDELEALIKEARARQLRRRLLGAAGVAIVAALGLSIYAVGDGGGPGGLVQSRPSAVRATGPHCRSGQLAVAFAFQGTTQSFAGGPTLRNTSDSTCSLPAGRPAFLIVWRGKTLRIPVRPGGKLLIAPPLPRAHVLAPGRRAFIPMRWLALPDIGGAAPPPRLRKLCLRQTGQNFRPQVELRYPDGLSLAARATGLSLPDCGPLHSSWMAVGHPMIEP